ncbi:MAG: FGGY family carbohydrate kinase, partial [Proteiniphilum sp.]
MYVLGYDIGSSSVKAALVEVESGKTVASDFYPKVEMAMHAAQAGWAEQDPAMWWSNLKLANASVLRQSNVDPQDIKAIGIS